MRSGRRRYAPALLVSLAAAGWACSAPAPDARAEAVPPETRDLLIFVFDRSTSLPDHQLELARELAEERLRSLGHGDRIAAMQLLQRSLAEPPKRWSQKAPERELEGVELARDSVVLQRFIHAAVVLLRPFSEAEDREDIDGTDILSTLHDVAAEMRAYPDHRAVMYLFSDMLQSNPSIDMEGLRRMPPDDWIARAEEEGRLPDLEGLCVVVVGARVDTEAAQRVKAFWDEYFEATGATLHDRNYVLRPVRLPEDPCE